jgi:WD40 repeat protein
MAILLWIAASPDGSHLAVGTQSGRLLLCSLQQRAVVHAVEAGDAVPRARWSPDGNRLFVATSGGRVLVLGGDGRQRLGELDTRHGTLRDLAVRNDGTAFATCGQDGALRLWDPDTLAMRHELRDGSVAATAVGFANGSVVAGYDDGYFVAWSDDGREKLASGAVMRRPPVYSLGVDATATRIVFGGGKGGLQEVAVGAPGDWRVGARWDDPPRPIAVNAVAFAPDGSFTAACSDDCARSYANSRTLLAEMLGRPFYLREPKPAWEQSFIVSGVCWVPHAQLLATCHFSGTVRLWRKTSCVGEFAIDG